MGGDMDHPQSLVGQHHGVAAGIGVVGVDFRVAGVVVPGHVDGLLAQGVGNGGVNLAGHSHLNHLFHILESSLAAHGAGPHAKGLRRVLPRGVGDLLRLHQAQVQHINSPVGKCCLGCGLDRTERQPGGAQLLRYLHGVGHAAHVAYHQGPAPLIDSPVRQGAHGDLRAIAKGVAHGDAKNRSFVHC